MLDYKREEIVWDWEIDSVPPALEEKLHLVPPRSGRRSFNLALLYLLVLVGIGIWISRNRLWERRLGSPLDTFGAIETVPSFMLPNLKVGTGNHVTHYVRSGEKLTGLFKRFGLDESEAKQIESAVLALGTGESLLPRPGRKITLRLSEHGDLEHLTYPVSQDKEIAVSTARTNGARMFRAKLIANPPVDVQVTARAEIRTSFAAAAKVARVPYEMIDDVADLFGDRIDFRKSFRPGDRFTLIFRQQMQKGLAVGKAGPIIAAVFEMGGKEIYALRYVGTDGKARYFDENGKLLGESFLRFPLQFSKITSVFSDARFHPILKITRPHNGVDFAAPIGTPVRTIGDGQIVFAGYNGPNGNMVRIRHNDRITTEYLHLSKVVSSLHRGTFVSKGELIGAVGMTGLATGPHLHFGMFDGGRYVDPLHSGLTMAESVGRGTAIDRKYLSGLLLTLHRHQTEELDGPSARSVSIIDKRKS